MAPARQALRLLLAAAVGPLVAMLGAHLCCAVLGWVAIAYSALQDRPGQSAVQARVLRDGLGELGSLAQQIMESLSSARTAAWQRVKEQQHLEEQARLMICGHRGTFDAACWHVLSPTLGERCLLLAALPQGLREEICGRRRAFDARLRRAHRRCRRRHQRRREAQERAEEMAYLLAALAAHVWGRPRAMGSRRS